MKDILVFKNMQDMTNEADDFLTKISDPESKACCKLLLVACYSYMNEFIGDTSKRTYENVSTLVRYEFMETEYDENSHSKMQVMIEKAPERSITKRLYNMYYNCSNDVKKKAQMNLMAALLPYYIK